MPSGFLPQHFVPMGMQPPAQAVLPEPQPPLDDESGQSAGQLEFVSVASHVPSPQVDVGLAVPQSFEQVAVVSLATHRPSPQIGMGADLLQRAERP